MGYAFYFDSTRCTGCKTCVLACKDYRDLPIEYGYRRVYDYEGGDWDVAADGTCTTSCFAYHVSVSCNHCEKPACTAACPTTAMHKEKDTGLVVVDVNKCIGCGYCHMACPYDAPRVDKAKGHSVKCDGCKERTLAGKKPICVEACPLRALEFGPEEEIYKLAEQNKAELADIAPLPPSSYTTPVFFVKSCPSAEPSKKPTGHVANVLEVE